MRFSYLKNWRRRHKFIWLVIKLVILCFVSIGFSVTGAQWWHEFGHIVVALGVGAPITEFVYWPPWQQHVTANFNSTSLLWQNLALANGFLITVIPLSVFFVVLALRKSNWAYIVAFPLFQTLPTSSGDLGALGIAISAEINGVVGWTMPLVTFTFLTVFYLEAERKGSQRARSLGSTKEEIDNVSISGYTGHFPMSCR